jgi:hypothetical protein
MSPATLVLALLLAIALSFIVLALVAPFETLSWWAGWGKDAPPTDLAMLDAPDETGLPQPDFYIVYLSGVGRLTGDERPAKEEAFLDNLQVRLPHAVIVRDIFPFSVTNNPLDGRRPLAPLWKWIDGIKHRRVRAWLYNFIQFRNLTQVAVSADPRYGGVYSTGLAREIVRGLLRHGYSLRDKRPVVLMCISGGGQVSVGAAPYLLDMLGQPIIVVSIGGVLTDDAGVLSVERVYQISGSLDNIQNIGKFLFPGRWRIFTHSAWNRAVRKGKIAVVDVGPMKHMGWGDYFSRTARLPDGQSHADRTAQVIAGLLMQRFGASGVTVA